MMTNPCRPAYPQHTVFFHLSRHVCQPWAFQKCCAANSTRHTTGNDAMGGAVERAGLIGRCKGLLTRKVKMPRRLKSSLSFLSTTFCARMSPSAFSRAALHAFVNTCMASHGARLHQMTEERPQLERLDSTHSDSA